jgi:hypothetical protein
MNLRSSGHLRRQRRTFAESASRGVARVRLALRRNGRRGDRAVSRLRERFDNATRIKVRETPSGRFSTGENDPAINQSRFYAASAWNTAGDAFRCEGSMTSSSVLASSASTIASAAVQCSSALSSGRPSFSQRK